MLVKRSPLIHSFIYYYYYYYYHYYYYYYYIIILKQKKTKEQKIKQKIKHDISDTLRQVQVPLSIFACSSKN